MSHLRYSFLCWAAISAALYYQKPFPLDGESLAVTAAISAIAYLPIALMMRLRHSGASRRSSDPLDRVLFTMPDGTPYTVRDLLKSVAIFGQIGSGKSSGSGLLLARIILRLARSGGLILASKPEDREFWEARFREAGRSDDLIIFGPDSAARCNFIDFEMQSGGDSRSLTEFLIVTGEALDKGGNGENGKFWEQGKKRMLYNAIEPCRVAHGIITIPMIQQFISTAVYHASQLSTAISEGGAESPRDKWRKGLHYQTMLAAEQKKKSPVEQHDFSLYGDYWMNEFPQMDSKVRSSILADVMNILFTYNTGIVREMVSTTTTISPAVMARGKWVLFDFPLDKYGDSGRIIMHGGKMLTQKFILRRKASPNDSVIVIHGDEAQDLVNSFDGAFLAKCRSHLGCMVYLTQSLHSYLGKLNEHEAKGLLTNFGAKIFHSIGDGDTAEWAAKHLGNRLQTLTTFQPKQAESFAEELFGEGGGSCSLTQSWQPVLQASAFMEGLRCGGPPDFMVDGIVVMAGRWQRVSFSQR